MRVGIRDAERLKDSPSSAPVCALGHLPPTGGEGFGAAQIGRDSSFCRTFGYIYCIGNQGGVRLLGGRPRCAALTRERGACPLIRPLRGHLPPRGKAYERVRTPAPAGIVGEKRRAHSVRPCGTITNGSIYKKRDRSGTCPLKHRGETQFRIKFLWFLSFSKKGTALFLLDVHHQAHPAGVAAALKLGV